MKLSSKPIRHLTWGEDNQPYRVRIKGLKATNTEMQIADWFKNYDLAQDYAIHGVSLIRSYGSPTGHAFVYFNKVQDCILAQKQMNGSKLGRGHLQVFVD
eukprot:Filipodium_phascolosomae@DN312_c0_g1_i1.p1